MKPIFIRKKLWIDEKNLEYFHKQLSDKKLKITQMNVVGFANENEFDRLIVTEVFEMEKISLKQKLPQIIVTLCTTFCSRKPVFISIAPRSNDDN